ncbi:alpha/beta fold hydrolase [Microbulbifer celer]|uniref:alpha/beta fold hydrolase n=1 Tax=Microbulbifer celer TaxID=435905 RepID=UPI001E4FE01F|nr:alpha/beta fold hydrolase [Microbulbifer celer]UFN58676.1 alpha/beta hydrolase [Microbulbifer celer]
MRATSSPATRLLFHALTTLHGNCARYCRGVFYAAGITVLLSVTTGCEQKASESDGKTVVAEPSRLIPKPCWFDTERDWPTTQCYMMEVPENHQKPAGRRIQFPVVRFFANITDPDKEPLLHLGAGGPGASMGLEAENVSDWLWANYADMSVDDGRDLIVIDPRGTGMATPKLSCTEFIEDANLAFTRNLSTDEESRVFTYSMERCYSRLSKTADLAHYNSSAIAADIEALRRAIGVPKLNLYGVSYASRYALTVARDFPDTVRAMVLNSAVFPEIIYTQQLPQDVIAAYQRGLDYCSKDKTCAKEYPDLKQRLEALVQILDEEPLTVETSNIQPDGPYPFVLTGQRLLRVLFQALYNESFYRQLPAIIQELESGQATLLKSSIASFMGLVLDPNFGDAAGISHFCYEEAPFVDFDQARSTAANSGILGGSVRSDIDLMQVQCRIWAIPSASMRESQPITTPVPTLIMHGGLDPVLSARDAEKSGRKLPHHQWLLFPELAHDVISASDCAEKAAAQFLDDPQQAVVDDAITCRNEELARQKELEQKLAEMRKQADQALPVEEETVPPQSDQSPAAARKPTPAQPQGGAVPPRQQESL